MHGNGESTPPPDDAAHEDSVLMAQLSQVNTQIARYVLRFFDADAGRTEPISTADERALADQVIRAAAALRARAGRRDQIGTPTPVIEHHH